MTIWIEASARARRWKRGTIILLAKAKEGDSFIGARGVVDKVEMP